MDLTILNITARKLIKLIENWLIDWIYVVLCGVGKGDGDESLRVMVIRNCLFALVASVSASGAGPEGVHCTMAVSLLDRLSGSGSSLPLHCPRLRCLPLPGCLASSSSTTPISASSKTMSCSSLSSDESRNSRGSSFLLTALIAARRCVSGTSAWNCPSTSTESSSNELSWCGIANCASAWHRPRCLGAKECPSSVFMRWPVSMKRCQSVGGPHLLMWNSDNVRGYKLQYFVGPCVPELQICFETFAGLREVMQLDHHHGYQLGSPLPSS